jgi:CheY-like chemotaxis protein
VAEDNLVNGMVIQALLAQLGLDVQLVGNGQQAVDVVIRGENPDVILMDIQMPVMDGYAATEQIRQVGRAFMAGPRTFRSSH